MTGWLIRQCVFFKSFKKILISWHIWMYVVKLVDKEWLDEKKKSMPIYFIKDKEHSALGNNLRWPKCFLSPTFTAVIWNKSFWNNPLWGRARMRLFLDYTPLGRPHCIYVLNYIVCATTYPAHWYISIETRPVLYLSTALLKIL